MSAAALWAHLILERLSRTELPRVPEPNPIMDAPAQVAAFTQSGREDGILAFTYFFHALQATPVILPGDKVLDLACGPANQLAQLARLNPDAHFIGVDASASMIHEARSNLARSSVSNVELIEGDMTQLDAIETAAMDGVICTMSLHHLPDLADLARTFREVRRVLRPGGGLYLADFGRLKRAATQHFFVRDRGKNQSPQFAQDFLHSLQAAFSVAELTEAAALLGAGIVRYQTPLAPFMVVFKTAPRRRLDAQTEHLIQAAYGKLTPEQRRIFRAFARWFAVAGFGLPCALA